MRLHGKSARDTQALLLAAGDAQAILVEFVLRLVPKARIAQASLHDLVAFRLRDLAHAARPVQDVVANAHREGIRVLEHHAHHDAKLVGLGREDVAARNLDGSLGANRRHEVAHAVECTQKRRLPATRGADERGRLVFRNLERDALQRLEIAIPQVEVANRDNRFALGDREHARLRVGQRPAFFRIPSFHYVHQPNLPVR